MFESMLLLTELEVPREHPISDLLGTAMWSDISNSQLFTSAPDVNKTPWLSPDVQDDTEKARLRFDSVLLLTELEDNREHSELEPLDIVGKTELLTVFGVDTADNLSLIELLVFAEPLLANISEDGTVTCAKYFPGGVELLSS